MGLECPFEPVLRERLILESTVQNSTTNLENRGISRSVQTSKRLQNMFMLVLPCFPAGGPHLFASMFVLLLKTSRFPVMRSLPLPFLKLFTRASANRNVTKKVIKPPRIQRWKRDRVT